MVHLHPFGVARSALESEPSGSPVTYPSTRERRTRHARDDQSALLGPCDDCISIGGCRHGTDDAGYERFVVLAVQTQVRGEPTAVYWRDGDVWGDDVLVQRLRMWVGAGWVQLDEPEAFITAVRRVVGSEVVVAIGDDQSTN